ncbi:MAG TPA: class I SAM-dependent methyltransferase [Pseudonocardiaceae bacterium]|jgi:release factor glutamine methyltransferase|nr:class I SAM-dependent methyltransferase [Pseudonocardiaceae bacterium]
MTERAPSYSDQEPGPRDDYLGSLRRSRLNRTRDDRPPVFHLAGREWDLLASVFPPVFSPSTQALLELLDFPVGGSVLEMGCGAGVIAVSAALAGCARVVATDVNPAAARNAELNAQRHGVADRVHCVSGDLFEPLHPEDTFDLVFWHSNFVLAPTAMDDLNMHDLAYVDPGYRAHCGYLAQAPDRVREGGVALLGFSSRGDLSRLRSLAADVDVEVDVLGTNPVQERDTVVEYQLLRLRSGSPRSTRPGSTW